MILPVNYQLDTQPKIQTGYESRSIIRKELTYDY